MTYREAMNKIPESFREEAITNIYKVNELEYDMEISYRCGELFYHKNEIACLIDEGFSWSNTKEGGTYWSDIFNKINSINFII